MTVEFLYYEMLVLLAENQPPLNLLPSSSAITALAEAKHAIDIKDDINTRHNAISREKFARTDDLGQVARRVDEWPATRMERAERELTARCAVYNELRAKNKVLTAAVDAHCERKADILRVEEAKRDAAAALEAVSAARARLKRKAEEVLEVQRELDHVEQRSKEACRRVEVLSNK